MAKSKIEVKIESEIVTLEKLANELYHSRVTVLAKLSVLTEMLKDK